ncbi:hypothetical protein [Mucilaginibacter kameinonensis]|uniref:hypothetical protein n=1 Tax=Mucilaginibacter kameinonensis TaxID=452286 RepID=UPI000EF7E58B|nr:hypothetical protein [Mucilaginibacter kameinonensis]
MQIKRVPRLYYQPECAEMHVLVEMIARGRDYFAAKMYKPREIIMHIPPPVQTVLEQSLGRFGVKKPDNEVYILGVRCIPGYENRIIMSHPKFAIYDNEPMVVIEFETINGKTHPVYYQLDELD